MSVERLRNVVTGEIKDIETNSIEYLEHLNEVYDHGGSARPKWEITGLHHVRRLDEGDVREADHGYAFKPIPGAVVGFDEVGPDKHPERALFPGEVEMGISSHEDKLSGLPGFKYGDNLKDAESIEEVPIEDRNEKGAELAGSVGDPVKVEEGSDSSESTPSAGSGSPSKPAGSGVGASFSGISSGGSGSSSGSSGVSGS